MLSFPARTDMSDVTPPPTAAAPGIAAAIARLAPDLALADEPSGFVGALEHDPDVREARGPE